MNKYLNKFFYNADIYNIEIEPSAAQGCSAAQLVVRWLTVRQARVRISARHPREVPPTEPAAMKIWRRASANVMSDLLLTNFILIGFHNKVKDPDSSRQPHECVIIWRDLRKKRTFE